MEHLTCLACNRTYNSDRFLMNHIYKHAQYDQLHATTYQDLFKVFDNLFYDPNIYRNKRQICRDVYDGWTYDAISIYWKKEFGESVFKERTSKVIEFLNMKQRVFTQDELNALTKSYSLSYLKKEVPALRSVNLNNIKSNLCPVCSKSFGRSLYGHCMKDYKHHKFFLDQQKQLAISLSNNFNISQDFLFNKGFAFSLRVFNNLIRDSVDPEYFEKRRVFLERQTKQNSTCAHNTQPSHTGKISAFCFDEIKDNLIIPHFSSFSYQNKVYHHYNTCICDFCHADIHETTLWNHCVLNRHDPSHLDFLIEQSNNMIDSFNDLTLKPNNKPSMLEHNIYAGPDKLLQLWKMFYPNSLIKERSSIIAKASHKKE